MRLITVCFVAGIILSPTVVQTQPFTNTVLQNSVEMQWGSLTVPGGYVTIGNSNINNPNLQPQFCRFNLAGRLNLPPVIVKTYTPPGVATAEMQARDIERTPASGGMPAGYYITGFTVPQPGQRDMFVLRVDNNGNVLWGRTLLSPFSNQLEEGVAVVTMPNGDVVAVGAINNKWVHATRFSPIGTVVWGNTYSGCTTSPAPIFGNTPVPNPDPNSTCFLIPKEACLDATGGTGTIAGGAESVAVTGVMTDATNQVIGANGQAFILNIGANGLELWRNIYPVLQGSTGYDILQDTRAAGAFGFTVAGSATQNNQVYVYAFHATSGGLQVWSQVFSSSANPSNVYARALMQGLGGTNYILAGPDFSSATTGPGNFVLEVFPAAPGAVAGFQHLYPSTGAPLLGAESLSGLIGAPGYVLATVDSPIPPDLHLVGMNGAGFPNASCPQANAYTFPTLNPFLSQFYVDRLYTVDSSWLYQPFGVKNHTPAENYCPSAPISCSVTADFSFINAAPGPSCGNVQFTNASTVTCPGGTTIYQWDFGDGNTSGDQHPLHNFSASCSESYNVCLTVKCLNPNGTVCAEQTICKTVAVNCCTAEPSFCFKVENGSVTFTDNSTGCGSLSYQWTFWDGTTSTAKDPIKTYNPAVIFGVKPVCLKVTSSDGCSKECCKDIYLPPTDLCAGWAPAFDYAITGDKNATFTNQTPVAPAGVTESYEWTDNGIVFSTVATPPMQTWAVGNHMVCFKATRSANGMACSKTICKTIVISGNCNPAARYSYRICTGTPFVVEFTDQSTGATSWLWDFGDGGTSVAQNPTHTYAASGDYTVCLTINSGSFCESKVCYLIRASSAYACILSLVAPPGNSLIQQPEIELEFDPAGKQGVVYSSGENYENIYQLQPNPSTTRVRVLSKEGFSPGVKLSITDVQGNGLGVYLVDVFAQEKTIDVSHLPAGMYLLAIHSSEGPVITLKLVKN